jgi:phosphopantothenoylcysteine decarboxylase / phosphopantothenate---cysteine ligase
VRGKRILLIVGGGIAAYKACELVRGIRKAGGSVRCVLTAGGAQFLTPMTLAALSEQPVHTSLWDLKDEAEMGHIRLSREADLVVVCPATADLLAKMAGGQADDLATTLLLATDKPVLACPAMNVRMWLHPATRRNVERLRGDGVTLLEPDEGDMACGEFGPGRLPEVSVILDAIAERLGPADRPSLQGKHILVTAGPTHEPIDPVRMLANRSSGKQGFAIAEAAARLGARVSLVAGPVALPTPPGVDRVDVQTALEMRDAVRAALPADAAVMVAAVADWRADYAPRKIKKGEAAPVLRLVENPDILAEIAAAADRPRLIVGFAAETDDILAHAEAKRARKGCDWIVANDVSGDVMGGEANQVLLVTEQGGETWERMSKAEVARRLIDRIAAALA